MKDALGRGDKARVNYSLFFQCAALAALGILIYWNSLNGKMLLDDELLIADNTYVKSFVHLDKIFTEDMGGGIGITSSYYRPLQALSYMVIYRFWELDPLPYHATNLIFHCFFVLSVLWMAKVLFKKKTLAFLAAALAMAHPIQPESVSYISGLGDCMVGFFTVLSFTLYVRQTEQGSARGYALLFAAYLAALFAKENSLVLPGLFIVYHAVLGKKIKMPLFLSLSFVSLVYLLFRVSFLKNIAHNAAASSVLERVPGAFAAVAGYMRTLLWPFDLSMSHGARTFGAADPQVIAGAVITLILLSAAFYLIKRDRLVSFSIFWFFVTLLPVSNLYPTAFYMADHYLYIPSVGFFLIAAYGLRALAENKSKAVKAAAWAAAAFLVAGLGCLTARQNKYWSEPGYFYERTLKHDPNSPIMWSNLAKEYVKTGKLDEGMECYGKAIEIDPAFTDAYYNAGVILLRKKDYAGAIENCSKAIKIDPGYARAYNIIGTAYWAMNDNGKALEYFEKAYGLAPSNISALTNLAAAYVRSGKRSEAEAMLEKAIKEDPGHALSYANLAVLRSNGTDSQKSQAVALFKKALELNPGDGNTWNALGKLYYSAGDKKNALDAFRSALAADPENEKARNNAMVAEKELEAGK